MLLSVYDPVQKRVVFGAEAEALRAQGGAAPASPAPAAPNVIPQAQPSSDPVEANAAAGYLSPANPESSGQLPARLGGAPAPVTPSGLPSVGRSMTLPTPAAAPPPPAQPGGAAVSLPMLSVGPPQQAPGPSPAPASNAGGGMMRQPLGEYYSQLEKERGLPEGYLARVRAIESSNGTRLANPNSSARGDFQFIRSTAKSMGIDPMDPYASARGAADLAADAMKKLQARGIEPTGGALYGAHQQGIGGYLKLAGGQRTGDAEMRLNGGAGLSGSQMVAKLHGMYDNAKPANLGEGFTPPPQLNANRGQGPTVAAATAQGGVQNLNPTPPAPDNTYKGGIAGLFGIGDQNAPGMSKDFAGKMGDMLAQPGGGAIGGLAKAIPSLLTGGAPSRAPMQFGPAPEDHKPEAGLLPLLQAAKRGRRVA
jgi:hypothetical protein